MSPHKIVLATINARYIHSALGLRYLKKNLTDKQSDCVIEEFTLESKLEDMAEKLLQHQPIIVGLGVYIWNVQQTTQLLGLLKTISPQTIVVLGGPEVSYQTDDWVDQADYVISGWGEVSFNELVHQIEQGDKPTSNKITGIQPKLDAITMPYALYNTEDIAHRVLYVEASRGCPYKCEFCLSALDKTAWPFALDEFLQQMTDLYQRGARHFKFVDRTFNLKASSSVRILEFFLDRMSEELFLHFEMIPDRLPDALKSAIAKFPVGSLQFEIGIQTFNPEVQRLISRKQDNAKIVDNITWLKQHSQAHLHTDLIFGLPGETVDSFATGFDFLYKLAPHEIQVGILKKLKGAPIERHQKKFQLKFNPSPPYNIVSTDTIDYSKMQEINRFARYWDLIANSGRFKNCLDLLLGDTPFYNFNRISQALFQRSGQTHKISLARLYKLVYQIAIEEMALPSQKISDAMQLDYTHSGIKSKADWLHQNQKTKTTRINHKKRQNRH